MPLAVLLLIVAGGGGLLWRYVLTSRSQKVSVLPGTTGTLQTRNSVGRSGAYFLPSGYEGRVLPLLVGIHGTGGDGAQMVAFLRDSAERRKFIVVAPDSRRAPSGEYTWQVGSSPGDVTEDFRHVQACVAEVLALPGVRIDLEHVLIAGHSGGGSVAPYVATNAEPYTAFAVLHGGLFAGGVGPRRVRAWFSTGESDPLRPPAGVEDAARRAKAAGEPEVEYRVYPGGHGVGDEELAELVGWWLGP